MITFLDLPNEIQLIIGEHLPFKAIYSCIRVCRSFYSTFIPRLWSDLHIAHHTYDNVPVTSIRANAHHVETINYPSILTGDYYTIFYPRLQTIKTNTYFMDKNDPDFLLVTPLQKIEFARFHPTVRKLVYNHNDKLPKEFWEVIGIEWTQLEDLEFEGVVGADAVDAFWRVCGQVQRLYLENVIFPESVLVPPTLSFRQLLSLAIEKHGESIPRQTWPRQLLEQIKTAEGLRRIKWDMVDPPFPAQMVQKALAEGLWPDLCELSLADPIFPDQSLAQVLRILKPQSLKGLELRYGSAGPLTYKSLQEQHFDHLQELRIGGCSGVTSAMVQEVLMECSHLVDFDAPFVFVRDIVKAPKPWSCLKLERLWVCIVKQEGDEIEWNGQVMRQISRLRRLQTLSVDSIAANLLMDNEPLSSALQNAGTLDLRLLATSQSISTDNCSSNGDETGGGSSDLRCWASLVQLKLFWFDRDYQTLGMEEALWMMEHWRNMWCLEGTFNGVAEGDDTERLRWLFKEKGITYYRYKYQHCK
ncbi:hypothetical protein BGZ88_006543 [Linnemannia elongata]|nr:hypothetical protein BGZ88_006543 [Linnemannia elongata]